MAASSPYDTAVANTPGVTNSWFFRDLSGTTATASAGAVNGVYTGGVGLANLSPLARDLSTPLSATNDVVGGINLGSATGPGAVTGGYVTFGDNFDFPTNTTFSATAFVRLRGDVPTSYTWVEMEVLDKCSAATRNGWDIAITANLQVVFRRWDTGGAHDDVTSAVVLVPQVWYFICATYDGTTMRLYVDDAPPAFGASTRTLPGNASNFTVGAYNGGASAFLDAAVGPVALWNGTVLTAAQVAALFTAAIVPTPRTFYVNSTTGNDTYDGTSAVFVSGSTGPWKSFFKAASSCQAGDTAVFAYNSGTPYVETSLRSFSAMAYQGTKRAGVLFTSDQPSPWTLKPVIQFGDAGTDLSNSLKLLILQQAYHTLQGLWFTQYQMGNSYNDRLVTFFGQNYGQNVGLTTALSGTGSVATYTVANSLAVGDVVTIAGAVPAGYNGTFPVTTASGTQFTVANTTSGAQTTAGSVSVQLHGEVQTLTISAGATGTWTATYPGNTATGALSTTITAAALQTALQATDSVINPGASPLQGCVVTGGPGGTAALNVFFNAQTSTFPYSTGPMQLFTVTQPTTSGTATPARTTAGTNGKRWYQGADHCTMRYCRVTNCYQPYKSAIDTDSTFEYNLIEACAVGIGCYNSNAPIFRYNTFLCNGTGQALRNGGNLQQSDAIQSKGGTRNGRIYGNIIHVPTGATPLTGVGIYVGGSSNAMDGEYDFSATGQEGYNNVAWNNVIYSDYPDGVVFAGIAISGSKDDLVTNNVVINATVATRIIRGGFWPTLNAYPKVSNPQIRNNIFYSCGYAMKWGNSQALDLTGSPDATTYDHNLRYLVTNADDLTQTNDIGGNAADPLFVNPYSDWHTDPGSPVSRTGVVLTQAAFGKGWSRGTIDLTRDYAGNLRWPPPDLGIYAFSMGGEVDVGAGPSFLAGVDTINVGPGVVGSGTEALRQIMVLGDPGQQGQTQRISVGGQALVAFALPDNLINANPAVITDANPHQLFPAAGGGLRTYISDLSVENSHATVGTLVTISDSGGTIWQGYAAPGGGGVALVLFVPRRQPSVNAVINVTCETTGAKVYVSAGGVKMP